MADSAHVFLIILGFTKKKKRSDMELAKCSPMMILVLVYIQLKIYQSYDRGKNCKTSCSKCTSIFLLLQKREIYKQGD
jgi:hypothetical protein